MSYPLFELVSGLIEYETAARQRWSTLVAEFPTTTGPQLTRSSFKSVPERADRLRGRDRSQGGGVDAAGGCVLRV